MVPEIVQKKVFVCCSTRGVVPWIAVNRIIVVGRYNVQGEDRKKGTGGRREGSRDALKRRLDTGESESRWR
jgi:hypothetical protein